MIVVDSGLVAGRFVPGVDGRLARRVCDRDDEWAVPRVWRVRFRDALLARVRAGGMQLDQAVMLERGAREILAPRDVEVKGESVLSMAAASGCAAADCEYVVLARLLDVRLVTTEAPLLAAFPALAVHPDAYLAERPE